MVTSKRPTNVTNDEIVKWLEWAGAKLIAMPGRRIRPAEPSVIWPDFAQETFQVLDFRQRLQVRAMAPSAEEITVMDEILPIPSLCPDHLRRRVIQARSLVHPINNRHLYRWTKIATMLHMDRRQVRHHHKLGIDDIAHSLPEPKVHTLRQFFYSTLDIPPEIA